ncbi:3'-5' exonuclease [Marinospirillum perlucidum]|uniref:3'-5' exonuclease n=1 Tax=Marinospirillum perlucidum TaxID=1982602 RepID=UPI000DF3C257|nr:3'-5' exonuclease [Marinospirillum perlucidum]
MPPRQKLLGSWLLLTGLSLFAGLFVGLWLTSRLAAAPLETGIIWFLSLGPTLVLVILGLPLEYQLFRPLRHLQVLLARLAANPDARDDYPTEGWLRSLQPDLDRLRQGWRQDRAHLGEARIQGAREAARLHLEMEALLQVLDLPLLLCDRHQRLLLFNPAAESLFDHHPALGLGRRLEELLPASSLRETLQQLPKDGSPRQLLLPYQTSWLVCDLRRVKASQGEALITLKDASERQRSDQRWRQPLGQLLPALRGHVANLATAGELLGHEATDTQLRERLQKAMQEDSQALGHLVKELAQLLEGLHQDQVQLAATWSNDLWAALEPSLNNQGLRLTPVGIPLWFQADTPSLLALLETLLEKLSEKTGQTQFEVEMLLADKRVYLDLIWTGQPLTLAQLQQWEEVRLGDEELAPHLGDILRRHASDWWSQEATESEQARLRIPLPAARRISPPSPRIEPRPEFHDFSIADLPPPDDQLGQRPLRQLEMVVFDTETTGLQLRKGDEVISIGACRLLQGRLLARDIFDQKVNPGRAIPPASTRIHGLTDADVAASPPLKVVLPRFRDYVGHAVLVAHNAAFDVLAVSRQAEEVGVKFDMPVLDTLLLSRGLDPSLEGHGLDDLAERFDLTFPPGTRHTALGDARVTAELLLALLPRLEARGITSLDAALKLQQQVEQGS